MNPEGSLPINVNACCPEDKEVLEEKTVVCLESPVFNGMVETLPVLT
jgi:hypothetical protein